MKTKLSLLTIIIASLLFTSCATIFGGAKKKVTFNTTTPGINSASLDIDGKMHHNVSFPYTTKIKGGNYPSTVIAKAEGYQPVTKLINKKFNYLTLLNIPLTGCFGILVDAITGAMTKPDTKECWIDFGIYAGAQQNTVNNQQITVNIAQGNDIQESNKVAQEQVSRDNPGATELEKTILRWYFDSDPRGARIFYRIISNIPSEVKNSNESYMTTTPLEETKSFNIPGLTYENSNNVTIEIKVTKRGYEDQVKRYNVRQAIDQQEISGFFELVPEE